MLKRIYIIGLLIVLMAFTVPSGFAATTAKKEYVVVIDAGHGGKDAGACDNNVKEKDVNLAVALELGRQIKSRLKNVKVVFTRDDDTFVTLQQRADKSNKVKADLFISIHTNSVDLKNPNRRAVAGASVYALGLHKDQNNLEVAMRENAVIELEKGYEEKYSGFDPNSDESYIIFEMTQKRNLAKSLSFARDVQQNLVKEADRADRGVHQAGFWVLWATSAPAVLVELDFICNPNSAKYIASTTGQEKMAKGIFKAVENYVKQLEKSDSASVEEKVEEEIAGGIELASSDSHRSGRVDEVPVAEAANVGHVMARRRRSESARQASNSRSLEVAEIPVACNEYPAVADAAVAKKDVAQPADVKKQDTRKNEAKKPEVQKPEVKQPVVQMKNMSTASKAVSPHRARVERISTVYRIQLAVSDCELKEDNAMFAGYCPLTLFKEHGLYKYTYGESANKTDLEPLLREVRQKVPDAIIIKCRK